MLEIKEIKDKNVWELFLSKKEIIYYPFFQSWNWGDLQIESGHRIWRLGVYNGKNIVAICQIIDVKAKRGHYLHLRHGPVLLPFDQKVFDLLIEYIIVVAKKNKAFFLRMSPLLKKEHIDRIMLKERGFISAPIHNLDAEICWVLKISFSEDELLKNMRKTHRYLIRKAQDMNIEIVRTQKVSDIDVFLQLYSKLSERKHFIPHSSLKEEFSIFSEDNQAVLFLAKYNKKIIAGAFIVFVENMAIYRHGASDVAYKDIPASYLLQWEAIKEAKKRGIKLYNFWGIAPTEAKNHPWQGLTLFKTGFGGEKVEFLHALDLSLNFKYWKTHFIDLFFRWKKGY